VTIKLIDRFVARLYRYNQVFQSNNIKYNKIKYVVEKLVHSVFISLVLYVLFSQSMRVLA